MTALFDENFYADVTAPLLSERMKKRIILRQPPDSKILRQAMKMAHGHLDYMDWLIDNRPWLAGSTMSMADLAAAAQISVADYLAGSIGRARTDAGVVFGVQKPTQLSPATFGTDGRDQTAGTLCAGGWVRRLRIKLSEPI